MANKFTRNITNVTDIEKVPKYTNNENDLLSHQDGKKTYIRRKKDYHCLTDNIKTVDVKGATDLLTAEVDNEENNVVMTAKRDNTKQNKLSVKTDTPETVDISLEKDVLQVDVKKSSNNNNGMDVYFNKKLKMQNNLDHPLNYGYIAYYVKETFGFAFSDIDVNLNLTIEEHGFKYIKDIEQKPNRFFRINKNSNIYTIITQYLETKIIKKGESLTYRKGYIRTNLEFCKKSNIFKKRNISGGVYFGHDETSVHSHDIDFEYYPPSDKDSGLVFKLNDDVIDYIDKTVNNWNEERLVVRVTDFQLYNIS